MEVFLSTQPVWITPQKPTDLAEKQLLAAILDGSFAIGSALPPERELAQALGITRPTLREALQRLARDGWIQIRQGKSTIVTDFWKEGNLVMLNALSQQPEALTHTFVNHLLQVRTALAPTYTRLAFSCASETLISILEPYLNLPDTPEAYAQADQELHHQLTLLSGNPIFTLIYNGFRKLSYQAGLQYFADPEARSYSQAYYQGLLQDARQGDADSAERRTVKVMQDSVAFWKC
jgi:GntR family negative regulator for fad regulon and positive regulator of fabA